MVDLVCKHGNEEATHGIQKVMVGSGLKRDSGSSEFPIRNVEAPLLANLTIIISRINTG